MFFASCDPDRENLSLYSNPDGSWVVSLPAEEVPPELPEPALGINFARDGMKRTDWLALVAVHSDAWLMSVAFYYSAKFSADQRCFFFCIYESNMYFFFLSSSSPKLAEFDYTLSNANFYMINIKLIHLQQKKIVRFNQ